MFFIPIPAFADHGLCWFHGGKRAVVLDPGDAKPGLRTLEEPALPLKPILVTRRHAHRTTGMAELRQATGAVVDARATQLTAQVLRLCANGRSRRPRAIIAEQKIKAFIPTRQATIMAAAQRPDASVRGDISLFTAIRPRKKPIQMTPYYRLNKPFSFAGLSSRLVSLAFFLLLSVLAGCATQPGMPGDPVLTTGNSPALRPLIPGGPLQAITPGRIGSHQIASTEPPKELWDRIRRGFAMPDLQNELVTDREQWYASRPDYMQRMTERSSKYLFHIVEELERRQMPTELALLPFIESAFNPQAVSSAKAAGMWQFMPATGKYFDLKQNVFRDDRRDVLASTRAALDYLQKLYGMFGDWHLALAAYNWGEGSVGRAIAKNQKAGLGTSYNELNMPAETRLYVPKLQAVKNIVANPQGFSTELPLIENHPYFQQVQITRDIDVVLAARLAGVKIEDFKALNPSAHRPVILAAGTPQILLPWDTALVFQRNFDAYTQGQYASWTAWTAPSTMNATDAARQTGMNEADLRTVNNIPPRMLIKAGSTLVVPRTSQMENDVTSLVADTAQVSLAPEIVTRRTTVKAGKHESVASIARRYGLAAASVADWNKVSASAGFRKGQAVVVFLPVTAHLSGAARSSGTGSKRKAVATSSARSQVTATKRAASKTVVKSKRRK